MIETLYNVLTRIGIDKGQDKVLHLLAGFVITTIIGLLFGHVVYGLIAGFVAAVGKEVYDYKVNGVYDFFDMFATLLGAFVGGALVVGLL